MVREWVRDRGWEREDERGREGEGGKVEGRDGGWERRTEGEGERDIPHTVMPVNELNLKVSKHQYLHCTD